MTFDRPWFLALAAIAPVLWILRRRLLRTEVVVASVLPFRAEPGDAAPVAPRRRADLGLAAAIASALLLAVAAAGPRMSAARRVLLVLEDRTAALDVACAVPSGAPRESGRENALAAARSLAAAVGAEAEILPFGDAEGATDAGARAALALPLVRGHGAARALVVSDRALPGPFLAVLPSLPPAPGAGITDVVLDGPAGRETLAVGVVSTLPVPAEATVRSDLGSAARVTLAPGARTVMLLPQGAVPTARSGRGAESVLSLELAHPATGGVADETGPGRRVVVRRPHVVSKIHIDGIAPGSALHDVLVVAGLADASRRAEAADAADVSVRVGGPVPTKVRGGESGGRAGGTVVFAPTTDAVPGAAFATVASGASSGTVRGSDVSGGGAGPAVALPAPGTRFVAPTRIQGGTAWLRDAGGALVASDGRDVVIAIDPSAAGDTFARDPAFAALVLAAIEHAAGGPDDLAATGLRPLGGWAGGAAGAVPPPDRRDVEAAVRDDASGGGGLATALAVVAALLAVAAARLSR